MKTKAKGLKLGKYRHYSGKLYEVLGIANHSESLEPMVVYQPLYDIETFGYHEKGLHPLWVRPLEMFQETIDIEGSKKLRFEFVEE